MVGKKNHVRLSASYRYYRATYQTIVWVYGYCVLLAQACDRLRTTRLRANNLLPNSKEQTRETDIWKIVHCAISATNYLLFGLFHSSVKSLSEGLRSTLVSLSGFQNMQYQGMEKSSLNTENTLNTEHWEARKRSCILFMWHLKSLFYIRSISDEISRTSAHKFTYSFWIKWDHEKNKLSQTQTGHPAELCKVTKGMQGVDRSGQTRALSW